MIRRKPMCKEYDPNRSYDPDHHSTEEFEWQGHTERVTRFKDGSSIRHGGGPCGPTKYDENGEEC